ncbi:general secretion pathway protein M [Vibrio xiamenensis]|uniref:Type II secretion system protein M n=1 Tax=Vibrio xiamenensis TaxID=861298 RepID=A0A1G8F373_9VIBR|nr:type II secretion system protein M [Vibrio xiamenensis]SDH76562.1 general secretion pathway protein M [Vibrio xiamenensis]
MKNWIALARQWWSSITQREQRLLICGAILLVLGILYWGIWQPVAEQAKQAEQRAASEKQLLSWVKEQANTITELRAQGGKAFSNQPLNQIISSSARRFNVELVRVQPRGDMMQVWVQPMPFNRLIDWIAYLRVEQGVNAMFVDLDKGDKEGVVDVKRLQFSKG